MTAMTPETPNNCDLNTDYFRLRIRWLGDGQGIKELAQTEDENTIDRRADLTNSVEVAFRQFGAVRELFLRPSADRRRGRSRRPGDELCC